MDLANFRIEPDAPHFARETLAEHRQRELEAEHSNLQEEVFSALFSGVGSQPISTPACRSHNTMPLADVFFDAFAGVSSDELRAELLACLAAAAHSHAPLVRLTTTALFAKLSRAHADYHSGCSE